mmetsp:Transcript_10778/g.26115  ORF Transcript_10778/g.26115 Transcript_10778/m.26115 type:complete len:230 (+) Transcript_10778:37-726(+)
MMKLFLVALVALARPVTPVRTQRVVLLRHGRTEMNEYLSKVPYNHPDFEDPMLFDTRLTALGERQADAAARNLEGLGCDFELIVSSPLKRSLETARRAFVHFPDVPIVVHPGARERQWHASDLGRERGVLEAEFGGEPFDWSLLPERGSWGYFPEELPNRGPVPEETEAAFVERLMDFTEWVRARPEQIIAVSTHWGVIFALVGRTVRNCQFVDTESAKLFPGAHLLGE